MSNKNTHQDPPIVLGSRTTNYLSKAILLEEAVSPRHVRMTIFLMAALLFGFLGWAAVAKLDIVATAPGQIVPSSAVQVIQHVDGGRIARIAVVEGQRVAKGDTLITLNKSEALADLNSLTARAKKLRKEVDYLRDIAKIRGDLARERLTTRTQALDAQRALAQQEGELASILYQIDKLKERLQRTSLVAPVDGVVQELKFRTLGGVIPPAVPVMNIVPADDVLRAEVRIATTDVGHLKVGQPVRIKVATYDFLRYGILESRLGLISANSSLDDKGVPYFKAYVDLARNSIDKNGTLPVMPGMTLQADIVMDRQTVLRYLLKPIYLAFAQGMRER